MQKLQVPALRAQNQNRMTTGTVLSLMKQLLSSDLSGILSKEPSSSTDREHIVTKQHQLWESAQTQNPLPAVKLQTGCNQYRLPSGKGKLADRMLRK